MRDAPDTRTNFIFDIAKDPPVLALTILPLLLGVTQNNVLEQQRTARRSPTLDRY